MKKTSLLVLVISIAAFQQFSCNKSSLQAKPTPIPVNASLVLHSSALVDIRASDIVSGSAAFSRKIEVIDRRDNSVFTSFVITATSLSASSDIYAALKNGTFSGKITIASGNNVLAAKNLANGKVIAADGAGTPLRIIEMMVAPCTVSTVHDCVAWKIDDMNWIDYGLCLASAPACYAGLWASCTWDVCVSGKTYVNPN